MPISDSWTCRSARRTSTVTASGQRRHKMLYEINDDLSVDIHFEPEEIGAVLTMFRTMMNHEGYDKIALAEAIVLLEGTAEQYKTRQ